MTATDVLAVFFLIVFGIVIALILIRGSGQ